MAGGSLTAARDRRARPSYERLEDRSLMTSPGYDYLLTGNSWANPGHITYSIAPDGVFWDHGTNNLNATFNARFGTSGTWQEQIAKALATWESVANINLVPVSDGPFDFNTLGAAQGDPRFSDIRFGGYSFPGNTTTLAQTYFPPPNGSTAAGDVEVNTSMNFGIGSNYDVYSVLLHETGHSLGLDHPKSTDVVMAANYGGIRTGLTAGDIAGIQAIYGPRVPDSFQQAGKGLSLSSAIDLSASLSSSNQAVTSGLSLGSVGGSEYFSFVAPAYAMGTLQVTAGASNISMLSPSVSVFDASGKLLAQAGNPSKWSDNATATVANVVAGERYFVSVTGATGDVFSVGAYQLMVSLPTSSPSPPTVVTPPPSTPPSTTPTPFSSPGSALSPDRFEPNNSAIMATWLGRVSRATLGGVNLNTGADLDYYKFQLGSTGSYQINAPGTLIQVSNARGHYVAGGLNLVNLPSARAGTTFYVRIAPPAFATVAGYSLSIGPRPVYGTSRRVNRPRHLEISVSTNPAASTIAPVSSVEGGVSFSSPSKAVESRGSTVPFHRSQSGLHLLARLRLRATPRSSTHRDTTLLRKEIGDE